ncbi:dockerin type I domain-containing protein [Candidatus Gracilibacteria bacterium]|nr:dockerin type I domain-containing protein [Candidatus Gracilibacteria bacterium]
MKNNAGIGIKDLAGNEIDLSLTSDFSEYDALKVFYGTYEEIACSGGTCTSIQIEKNLIGFNGTNIKIPVLVENFNNIGGFELELNYDSSQLNCQNLDKKAVLTLGSSEVNFGTGFISLVWDDNNNGVLSFGSGKILDFNCSVIGNIGDGSNLVLKINELGDGNGNDLSNNLEDVKTFFIQENLTIGGKILNPDGTIFTGGKIFLKNKTDNSILEEISNSVGYLFGYLVKGQNFELTAGIIDGYEENTVGTGDILKIQKNIIKSEEFTNGYNCVASDVNGDGKISVLDIIKIRRYLSQNTPLPSGNFKFLLGNVSCQNLGNVKTSFDLNNLQTSTGNLIFTKVRMGNVEN